MVDPTATPPPRVRYLERVVEDRTLIRAILHEDDDLLSPHVIRSICAALEVDPVQVDPTFDDPFSENCGSTRSAQPRSLLTRRPRRRAHLDVPPGVLEYGSTVNRLRLLAALGALLAATLVGEASVAALGAGDSTCRDDCEGDGGEDCPPFCGDCAGCVGCFRPLGIVSTTLVPPAAPARPARSLCADEAPPSPEPADILVVPRASRR